MAPRVGSIAGSALGLWLLATPLAFGETVSAPQGRGDNEVVEALGAATNLPELIRQQVAAPSNGGWDASLAAERERLVEVLTARGYLDARVSLTSPPVAGVDEVAAKLQISVEPGQRYTIGLVRIDNVDREPALVAQLRDVATTTVGEAATEAVAQDLSDRLTWKLGTLGFPFVRILKIETRPRPGNYLADMLVTLDAGTQARYEGADLSRVDGGLADAVTLLLPFRPGDPYSVETVQALHERIAALDGVGSVDVDVNPGGAGGFMLALDVDRAYVPAPATAEAGLGFLLLIATMAVLGWRQVAMSGRLRTVPVSVLTLISGGLFVTSMVLLTSRALSFL